jgi:hypothetical protein
LELLWNAILLVFWGVPAYFFGVLSLATKEIPSGLFFDIVSLTTTILVLGFTLIYYLVGIHYFFSLFWKYFGIEVLEFDSQHMTITRKLFRWIKSKRYNNSDVSNIRIDDRETSTGFDLVPIFEASGEYGKLAFDYNGATVRFGYNIADLDVANFLEAIQKVVRNDPAPRQQ